MTTTYTQSWTGNVGPSGYFLVGNGTATGSLTRSGNQLVASVNVSSGYYVYQVSYQITLNTGQLWTAGTFSGSSGSYNHNLETWHNSSITYNINITEIKYTVTYTNWDGSVFAMPFSYVGSLLVAQYKDPLQSSGPISLLDIANAFGGSAPHSLSEYYGVAGGIPGSGSISLGNFYGAS